MHTTYTWKIPSFIQGEKKLVKKIIKCFHDSNRCKIPTTLGENEDINAEGCAVSPASAHMGTSPFGATKGCLTDEEPSAWGLFRREVSQLGLSL